MTVIGWRCWYCDGSTYSGRTLEDCAVVPNDGVLVRMIYSENGGKEIQHGTRYYYAAPHVSGGVVYDNDNDEPDEIRRRYPGAVVMRGKRAPDNFYRQVVDEAMRSSWEE